MDSIFGIGSGRIQDPECSLQVAPTVVGTEIVLFKLKYFLKTYVNC